MVRGEDYKFLKIRDAFNCLNQRKVNLVGAILAFGLPRKTKGSDYFCKLRIIDESNEEGIPVHVFAEDRGMLPSVASSGDIIQLCRVMIQMHNSEVYAIFNKRFSSFALYEGKDGQNLHPYQTSVRFHHREEDEKLTAGLRNWLDNVKLSEVGSIQDFPSLKDIKDDRVNLACKVLHLCEVDNGWLAFLWDGTDAQPITVQRKLEDEMGNQLPLHLEPLPLTRDVFCTFPTVGTILRVFIRPDHAEHFLRFLEIGKWVKVLSVICEMHAGLWRGMLIPSTMLQHVDEEDIVVQERLRMFDQRLTMKHGRMPLWSFPWPSPVTDVDHEDVVFSTLMDVVAHSKVTAKFKCVVRFVAAFPWRVEDFRSPRGIYRIRFTLEDPTTRIHAFVYAEDGETFFNGYPSTDILKGKLDKLLGITTRDDRRNPPWVQCCLKSYYLDKSNKWETRQYRIFDTKITDLGV